MAVTTKSPKPTLIIPTLPKNTHPAQVRPIIPIVTVHSTTTQVLPKKVLQTKVVIRPVTQTTTNPSLPTHLKTQTLTTHLTTLRTAFKPIPIPTSTPDSQTDNNPEIITILPQTQTADSGTILTLGPGLDQSMGPNSETLSRGAIAIGDIVPQETTASDSSSTVIDLQVGSQFATTDVRRTAAAATARATSAVTTPETINSLADLSSTESAPLATGTAIHNPNSMIIKMVVPAIVAPLFIAVFLGICFLRRRRRNSGLMTTASLVSPYRPSLERPPTQVSQRGVLADTTVMSPGLRQSTDTSFYNTQVRVAQWAQPQRPKHNKRPVLFISTGHLNVLPDPERGLHADHSMRALPNGRPELLQETPISVDPSTPASRSGPLRSRITRVFSQRGREQKSRAAEADSQLMILREKVERLEAVLIENNQRELVEEDTDSVDAEDGSDGPPAYTPDSLREVVVVSEKQ